MIPCFADRDRDRDRKIRFEDDDTRDPTEPEKDTRLKFKPAVSALQVKMLRLAGQEVPMVPESTAPVSSTRGSIIGCRGQNVVKFVLVTNPCCTMQYHGERSAYYCHIVWFSCVA